MSKSAAQALGCRCDECPLKEAEGPVLPEKARGARFTVLGEAPGPEEIKNGRPFVGTRANLLTAAMRKAGLQRRDTVMQKVVMCQPPKSNMKVLLSQLRGKNAARRKKNNKISKANKSLGIDDQKPLIPLIPTPQECCRPAVVTLFRQGAPTHVLALGKDAAGVLLGSDPSIQAIRGSVLDGNLTMDDTKRGRMQLLSPDTPTAGLDVVARNVKIIPSLSVGLIFVQRRWFGTFVRDIDRLVRWSKNALTWVEPQMLYSPPPHILEEFLAGPGPFTYDVETDGIEALSCNVRCVGIGTGSKIVVVGVRSKETYGYRGEDEHFYSPAAMDQVKEILRRFFASPTRLKIGHNAGYYDKLVIRNWLGVETNPTLDTIMLHRLVESELPHSLSFVGSKYTDVHSWKADRKGRKLATEAETDRELHHYCGIDVAVTAAVVKPLIADVQKAEQSSLIDTDHAVQCVCTDMHHAGMYVDQKERHKAEQEGIGKVLSLRKELCDVVGIPNFNPASVYQLRKVLFDTWKLSPPLDDDIRFTEAGDPSTGDLVLRSLLSLDGLNKQHRRFILLERKYRKVMKELGTYIVKLRPMSEIITDFGWDDDELPEIKAERLVRGYEKRGIVWADGRMRPGYNAHVALTGRLSSSSPINAQNFPKHLRRLIIPQKGNVLVGADYDQLELRIAAARWKLQKYLDAFEAGWDPHTSVTALAVFGDAFRKAATDLGLGFPWMSGTKFKGDANDYRQLAKIIQYAYQYKASVETGARIIQSMEISDPDTGGTKLPYLKMPVRKVRQMRGNWLQGVPALERGWSQEIAFFRARGFVQEPIHGRKRLCLDGENPNEIVNFPIQSSASALVNDAMIAIHKDIPLHKWGSGTGLLTQTHDSLVVECPESAAPWVIECINHHMNKTHDALPGVVFTANAEAGMTWKEVG